MPVRRTFFTTEMYPQETRQAAWRDALAELSLDLRVLDEQSALFGTIITIAAPSGIVFSRVTSCTQRLRFGAPDKGATWLALQQAGKAELTHRATKLELAPGDIAYGPLDSSTEIRFEGNFRQMLVSVPAPVLGARSATRRSLTIGHLPGHSGIGHVFAGLLSSVSDTMGRLTDDEVWPIESASLELLITALANESVTSTLTDVTSSTTMSLHRVLQLIEARLADPHLSVATVAKDSRISSRYLQKLLKTSGTSFGHVIRRRRLERCRADIVNPLYAHLSLSDICFRWGFSDAAHFSRAFHDHYGVSPRDYRRTQGVPTAKRVPLEFSRSYPDGREDLASPTAMGGRGLARPDRLRELPASKRPHAATPKGQTPPARRIGGAKHQRSMRLR
jgi:AraC-like DNA-binding protein